jgi:hypothetical protein
MTNRSTHRTVALILVLIFGAMGASNGGSDFLPTSAWDIPPATAVYSLLEEYLSQPDLTPDRQSSARDTWRSFDDAHDLLDRLAAALAKADDRVAELVAFCSKPTSPGPLPEFAWLADSETPVLVRHNMRLYLARHLVQHGYFDEALDWTKGLKPGDVVAPDALLFYRAVAHHRLVQPDDADTSLAQLQQRETELPMRYQKLADLMRQDLATLEDDSLDHIARRMDDIRRRLALGRSGSRVQEVESGVIESLDKLIKKIEEQMQQQQQQAGGSSSRGGQPSGTPMEDSQIAELKGPGKVEPRDIGRGAGWGNLPDRDREKALQDIGRDFPSHYREVIEEYFRRLAAEESDQKP